MRPFSICFISIALSAIVSYGAAEPMVDGPTDLAERSTPDMPGSTKSPANRLAYLDGADPYYVGLEFPKLITPQWVGEPGVDAVVTLGIDDMNAPQPWVGFLQPAIKRLKEIYGYAPVSIMTTRVDPTLPDWPKLLEDGVSLECHTFDHPCPILRRGDFPSAKATYDKCLSVMNRIPGNKPVAFRVPCCDSLNTPSPRFYAEIFNRTNDEGQFLRVDSSVFHLFTADDPDLPRELVLDADGRETFRKYVPFPSFVNTIENYPYPYVIGRLCWQLACTVPSDWEAQNLHKPGNPQTTTDWKKAIDSAVIKRGMFNFCFHPYIWCRPEQVVELIDHCHEKYGKRVRVLSFKEVTERLREHLLAGQPLRSANGQDNGVRLLDLDNDGYLDVVIGNEKLQRTRLWSPDKGVWIDGDFPALLVDVDDDHRRDAGVRFGIVDNDGRATMIVRNEYVSGGWRFDGRTWIRDDRLLAGLEVDGEPIFTSRAGRDGGVRLRDVDGDGRCEVIVGAPQSRLVFAWNVDAKRWERLPFTLPALTRIVDEQGRDAGLRFVDIDEDGYDDVLFSDESRYSLHLYRSAAEGWSHEVLSGQRGDERSIPPIVRGGTNNGAWVHSRHLWVQNEDTSRLPDLVERASFNDLLIDVDPPPKTPAAALASMHPRTGFAVKLVAAEPLVADPVAIDWGADGRLWVVEMGDYPLGADDNGAPGGRVRVLEDTNDDGQYDRSTVFLDDLVVPTGVMCWRDGVLITAAPDILFARDTDGDNRADEVETLFTGLVRGNQQHRVNGLRWGLDNWVYCANGDSGGGVRSTKTGESVDIRGRDFRIRPDDGRVDAVSGMTQFGRCRDDWGNWFGGNNTFALWHFVLDERYLRRNPHAVPPDPRVNLTTPAAWPPVYPISRTVERFNNAWSANRLTSACGPDVYRDELFGPAFADNYFVCEPVHNLVHREVMEADGVTFRSHRAAGEERSEFLASSDPWFRPTQARTGPDGALWIVDMYRQTIEHPEWIPDEWQRRLVLRAGADRGRIWRVFPIGAATRPLRRLDRLDSAGLVAVLDSRNGIERDMAHRLLFERQDQEAIKPLKRLFASDKRAQSRLQALGALEALDALTPTLIGQAIEDPEPAIRRWAVRLSERFVKDSRRLRDLLVQRVEDDDAKVRLQLALSLGEWDDPAAGDLLARLAIAHADDPFMLAAVMSSAHRFPGETLAAAIERRQEQPSHTALIRDLLALTLAVGDHDAAAVGFRAVATKHDGGYARWQYDVLAGVARSLDQRGMPLSALYAKADGAMQDAIEQLDDMFAAARRIATDDDAAAAERVRATSLLGRDRAQRQQDLNRLYDLLAPQTPSDVQAAVVTALGELADDGTPTKLLDAWQQHSPSLRQQIIEMLLSRPQWTRRLVEALGERREIAATLSASHRQRLLSIEDDAIRSRIEELLGGPLSSDRKAVVTANRKALRLAGDAARGRTLFQKNCAVCHQLGGLGNNVGPDLRSLTNRSPEALLTAILDPNLAVESRYMTYQARTVDGRVLSGMLAGETGNSVTLVDERGRRHVMLRVDLEALISTEKSLMPEGLEKELSSPQDVADVIAFVAADHAPRKMFAGNTPETVVPNDERKLVLTAANAHLYGPEIRYYHDDRLIGDWHTAQDYALWEMEIAQPGTYDVAIEWSCADHTAGNAFRVEVASGSLTGTVDGTGGWTTFRREKVGAVTLDAGPQSLVVRSDGEIKGQALFDIRTITLTPTSASSP